MLVQRLTMPPTPTSASTSSLALPSAFAAFALSARIVLKHQNCQDTQNPLADHAVNGRGYMGGGEGVHLRIPASTLSPSGFTTADLPQKHMTNRLPKWFLSFASFGTSFVRKPRKRHPCTGSACRSRINLAHTILYVRNSACKRLSRNHLTNSKSPGDSEKRAMTMTLMHPLARDGSLD